MVIIYRASLNEYSMPPPPVQSCGPWKRVVKIGAARAGRGRWLGWCALIALALMPAATALADQAPIASAADPPECRTVRFSDIGWTDVTSTTAIVAQLLRTIG